jgi:hypothetical protein
MDNKINFMSRILAKHGNLNRVEFVFIMIFAARNCMLLNKSSFSLEDVSQAPHQCEIEGRRTEFHNASPNSTRLRLNIILKIIWITKLISCPVFLQNTAILIVLSSETRYGIQFSDLQFHIVVELDLVWWIQLSPNFHTFSFSIRLDIS